MPLPDPVIAAIVSAALAAAVTSPISAWLASRQLRSQRWWEKKAELYSKIIEGLYDIYFAEVTYLEDHYYNSDEGLSEEQKAARKLEADGVYKRKKEADEHIQRIAVIGTFIVSDAVAEDLLAFRKACNHALRHLKGQCYDSYSAADETAAAAKECIRLVREHAKEDLGLRSQMSGAFKGVSEFASRAAPYSIQTD